MTTSPETKVTALIMAGKRSGVLDPLAARANVAQKCVVPVGGMPMIERVIANVAACDRIGEIRVVAHEPDEIAAIPSIEKLAAEGRLVFKPGAFNLVDSVFSGADGAQFPLLITTADNCLWLPQDYAEFVDKAIAAKADAAAALARKEGVIAADPVGQKKFYEFSDGGFSNCNTYWIGNAQALSAAEIMRGGGQFMKFPSRIAKAFGVTNLIRFFLGWGTKEKLFAQVSRRFGFNMVPLEMSNGYCAIDVDEERSFGVTERLLMKRDAIA
ncbi:NTP transferase domain-containing protein [Erythrobacter mangrovi]|uniref:NTP transferase domain-containing protein n=1 Tax=Erythrobacter mangrovi TaxID=2739433 RepID=A0A7D3XCY2_9SPHN|nr:NTP transferase domain-containing protein [Erythrobacter mangrovi]QKG72140.1 NTP transferase domain-containing protein [Erythrobacter mangrovi]